MYKGFQLRFIYSYVSKLIVLTLLDFSEDSFSKTLLHSVSKQPERDLDPINFPNSLLDKYRPTHPFALMNFDAQVIHSLCILFKKRDGS